MTTEPFLPALLDLFLKSSAILGLAIFAALILRRVSAANRHVIWLSTLVALLLLPLTKLAAPLWSYSWEQPQSAATVVREKVALTPSAVAVAEHASPMAPAASAQSAVAVDWMTLGVGVWLSGMLAIALHATGARWWLARLARRSRVVPAGRWQHLVNAASAGVEVRESTECRVPMAAGVWEPVILLPSAALAWSDARLSAALRHEFGHIRRRDCLSRLLLDLACAIYWVNPLMWIAARSMRIAQEQACDDIVLCSGASAADYATQLVDVVRELSPAGFATRQALAMAQPSTLETRVRAIVDADRDRRTLSGATMTCGILGAALALALCSIAQLEGAEKVAKPDAAAPDANAPQIMVEAKFFEVEPDALSALPWVKDLAGDKAGVPAVAGVFTKEQEADTVKALNTIKGVDLLAAPRVISKSGQRAVIEIAREFRYPTEWRKDAKTGGWVPSAYDMKNIGITFGILGDVKQEGMLELTLNPEVVECRGFRDLDAPGKPVVSALNASKPLADRPTLPDIGKSVPAGHRGQAIFSTRTINISISTWDGQAVLLGLGAANEAPVSKRRTFALVRVEVVKPQTGANAVTITSDSIAVDKATGAVTASGDVKVETADATILAQNAEVRPKNAAPAPTKSAAMEKAETIILPKMEFRDATVREAAAFLTAKSRELDPEKKGVNIVLKLPETDTTTITLSLENVPLSEALKYVAELAGLKIDAGADGFVLRGGAPAAALVEPAAGTPEAQLLARARGIVVPKIVFRDATVAEAAEFLRVKGRELDLEKKAVNIIVMPSKANPDVRITLDLSDVPLVEALRYVAQLSNHKLEISPSAFVLRPIE